MMMLVFFIALLIPGGSAGLKGELHPSSTGLPDEFGYVAIFIVFIIILIWFGKKKKA